MIISTNNKTSSNNLLKNINLIPPQQKINNNTPIRTRIITSVI
jgi:hypothetical protein